MRVKGKPFLRLTAGDLMSPKVVSVPQDLCLRDAAAVLSRERVSGVPVVDGHGRCVGSISTSDVARLAMKHGADVIARPPRPVTCIYQDARVGPDGRERVLCTLPQGVCPFQWRDTGSAGADELVCTQPHCVCVDWQVVQLERMPAEQVRQHMVRDPVLTTPETPIRLLARMMIDAGIHRVFVVDRDRRPVGVVSSTDILAAVAYLDEEPDADEEDWG